MSETFRFAHISDLHFGLVTFSPSQFFSKRWLGNLNYLFIRKRSFCYERLLELVHLFKAEGITSVFITGDFSTTSRKAEFKMGIRFVRLLEKEGMTVYTIPGNHDNYTKGAHKKQLFYKYFPEKFDASCHLSLKEDQVTYAQINDRLTVVALDTTVATSFVSSQGLFSQKGEEALKTALSEIPVDRELIFINHFPFSMLDPIKKQMLRGPALQSILEGQPNALLYLHGHTHRQTLADLRPSKLPIVSDPGSTPLKKHGTCHLFQIDDKKIKTEVLHYEGTWQKSKTHTFER